MADPAAQPGFELRRPRPERPRRSRIGVAILATVAGIAVLGVGFGRSAGSSTGSSPATIAARSAAAPVGSPVPSGFSASSSPGGGPSTGPAASPSAPPSGPPSAVLAVRLQSTLERMRVKLAIPGVSATVLLPDGTTWTGVSGLADVGTRTQVTPDTAFAYASVSKTFTSALILQLIDEGKLRLTDSAAAFLPPLRLAIDRRITVGMLLNHTSGLADYFLNPKIDRVLQARPADAWPVDRTLGYVGQRVSAPGAAWHYANTNYLLLGLIAERLTGQTLGEAIRTRLLDPTGLASTWFQAEEPVRTFLAHGYRFVGTKPTARPIDLDDGSGIAPFRSVITAAGGAGSIAGTSDDLARWARALYSGKVLGPGATAMLLSGFTKTRNYLPGVVYGYGVQAVSIGGHASLGHSGRLLGFRSAVRHFPIDGLTIAVLTNQSRTDPGLIVQALLAVAAPPPPTPPVPTASGAPGGTVAPSSGSTTCPACSPAP